MAGNVLDGLPVVTWFLGLDLYSATIVIATIGVIHPTAYIYSCFRHRGRLFVLAWCLAAVWCGFSVGLFVGITQNLELAYECWIWCTFVFAPLMVMLMGAIVSYCYIRLRANCLFCFVLWLAVGFYWVTIYFIFVVNSRRMEAFRSDERSKTAVQRNDSIEQNVYNVYNV